MTDGQFKSLMEKVDAYFALREEKYVTKDAFDQAMLSLHAKMDRFLDFADTDEKERLALTAGYDRQLDNHERRISSLELTAN